jgi:hypothetical protein
MFYLMCKKSNFFENSKIQTFEFSLKDDNKGNG